MVVGSAGSAFSAWRPPIAPDPLDPSGEWRGASGSDRRFAAHRVVLRCTAGLRALQERRLESRTPDSRSIYSTADGSIDAKQLLPLLASRYRVKGSIGEGTSAKVRHARSRRLAPVFTMLTIDADSQIVPIDQILLAEDVYRGREVAIKVFHRTYYTAGLFEAAVLRHLNSLDPEGCCGCVRVHDCFTFAGHACLVLDRLQGTLVDLMVRLAPLPASKRASVIRSIAAQVLALLCLMHSQGLVHADLKPENVLVESLHDPESSPEPHARVKVVDFGNSFVTGRGGGGGGVVQTLTYRAPEVFRGLEADSAIDMWSLGCLLAEMATLKPLFSGITPQAVAAQVEALLSERGSRSSAGIPEHHIARRSHAFFKLYDDLAKTDVKVADLVDRLLRPDPLRRLVAREALWHPFLQRTFPFGAVFGPGSEGPGAKRGVRAAADGADGPGSRRGRVLAAEDALSFKRGGGARGAREDLGGLGEGGEVPSERFKRPRPSDDDTRVKVFDLLKVGAGENAEGAEEEDEEGSLEFVSSGGRARGGSQVLDSPVRQSIEEEAEHEAKPASPAPPKRTVRERRERGKREWWKAT